MSNNASDGFQLVTKKKCRRSPRLAASGILPDENLSKNETFENVPFSGYTRCRTRKQSAKNHVENVSVGEAKSFFGENRMVWQPLIVPEFCQSFAGERFLDGVMDILSSSGKLEGPVLIVSYGIGRFLHYEVPAYQISFLAALKLRLDADFKVADFKPPTMSHETRDQDESRDQDELRDQEGDTRDQEVASVFLYDPLWVVGGEEEKFLSDDSHDRFTGLEVMRQNHRGLFKPQILSDCEDHKSHSESIVSRVVDSKGNAANSSVETNQFLGASKELNPPQGSVQAPANVPKSASEFLSATNHDAQNFRTCIFYMPHCGRPLLNNVLFANWTQLGRCLLICNSMSKVCSNFMSQAQAKSLQCLVSCQKACKEVPLPEFDAEGLDTVFNDMSVHWIDNQGFLEPELGSGNEPEYGDLFSGELV